MSEEAHSRQGSRQGSCRSASAVDRDRQGSCRDSGPLPGRVAAQRSHARLPASMQKGEQQPPSKDRTRNGLTGRAGPTGVFTLACSAIARMGNGGLEPRVSFSGAQPAFGISRLQKMRVPDSKNPSSVVFCHGTTAMHFLSFKWKSWFQRPRGRTQWGWMWMHQRAQPSDCDPAGNWLKFCM